MDQLRPSYVLGRFLYVSDIISAVTPEKFDKAASDAIAQTVADIEKQTNAEVVVVVRGRSGTYRHADYLFGAIVAFLGVILILFLPWEFHTYWIPFDRSEERRVGKECRC